MSSRSYLIDTTQSMIIVDPNDFPLVMGATTKTNEDKPTTLGEVMAYDGRNILPTPAGYMSYFDQSTKIDIGNLADKLVQEIFFYQSANLHSVAVALCEDGIYVANATTGFKAVWSRIVNLSAGVVVGVRRLWTVAVVANRTIMYQQGQDKFWALVTPDRYAEAATPSPIAGATRAQVWANWGAGLLSYVPTFLNMTGQVGLFRADNRLGFWDSDSAVSWSSNLYIEDFTPSVKTFAGVTKFADVAGRITKILGAGDGFIIYATKSIVYGGALEGSPEKWRGEAILSGQGVSFDTQITAGQPDTTQYCITSAGLMVIEGKAISAAAPGVIDYLALNNKVLSLKMIEGRYLFIHCAEAFTGSVYGVSGKALTDFNNNEYLFQPPNNPWQVGSSQWYSAVISGKDGLSFGSFDDYEAIPGVTQPTNEALIPCYDVRPFDSSWVDELFEAVPTGTVNIPSKLTSGHLYPKTNGYIRGLFGPLPSYYLKSTSFDQAGDDLATLIMDTMADVQEHLDYQVDWFEALASSVLPVDISKPSVSFTSATPVVEYYSNEQVSDTEFFNHIRVDNLIADASECHTKLYIDRYSTLKVKALFTGEERYTPGLVTWGGRNYTAVPNSLEFPGEFPPLAPTHASQVMWLAHSTPELLAEFKLVAESSINALKDANQTVIASMYTSFNMTAKLTVNSSDFLVNGQNLLRYCYVRWLLSWAPELVTTSQPDTYTPDILARLSSYMNMVGLTRTKFTWNDGVPSGIRADIVEAYGAATSGSLAQQGLFLAPTALRDTVSTLVSADLINGFIVAEVSGYETSLWTVPNTEPVVSFVSGSWRCSYSTPTLNVDRWVDVDSISGIWRSYNTSGLATDINTRLWTYDPGYPAGGGNPNFATEAEALARKDLIMSLMATGSIITRRVRRPSGSSTLSATTAWASAWYTANGYIASDTRVQKLVGELRYELEYEHEDAETEIMLLDLELSGWGYMPYGGFSFRKTHSRHGSTTCPMPGKSSNYLSELPGLGVAVDFTPSPELVRSTVNPPYQWDYPTSLPLPDNYALFQVGSLAPYYPTYVGAVVYDQVQEKWGKFDALHKLVYEINPINRADETITLNPDTGMLAGSLNPVGLVSMFGPNNPEGLVVYGKVGYYRLGMTTMQEARAYFNAPAIGNIIVEASIDGTTIDPQLSYAVELSGQTTVLLNFTSVAKWFNIRIEGQFRLITLQVNLESAGRR